MKLAKIPNHSLAVFALCAVPLGSGAQERQMMGNMTIDLDGVVTTLDVFEGPLGGLSRALATYQSYAESDWVMISIEGVTRSVEGGVNPMQGHTALRMEFTDAATLGAARAPDNISITYVEHWPADRTEPVSFFQSTGDEVVQLDTWDVSGEVQKISAVVSGTLCRVDMQTGQTFEGPDDCKAAEIQFATSLAPHAPPVPVETPADSSSAPSDEGPVTLNVMGQVEGTLNGQDREWVTLSGQIDGAGGGSATWHNLEVEAPFRDTDMAILNISISGHDPASRNILKENVLSLSITLVDSDVPLGQPLPAEIIYVAEASDSNIPAVFYTSGEGGLAATVTFEHIELSSESSQAVGVFAATLCRVDGARLTEGADLSDCFEVDGRFDTDLLAE